MASRTPRASAEWHPAVEQYCETIYALGEERVDVIQARIAERLDLSRPTVSEMIHRMEADGLVERADTIRLTEAGRVIAEQVVRRHRLAERFLTDVLRLSWAEAHLEAGKWEHVISPRVETALMEFLGEPTTCPHGNPIPGSGFESLDAEPLSSLTTGTRFTVRRIQEELESSPGILDFLQLTGLVPGRGAAFEKARGDGSCTVTLDGSTVPIGADLAERILVTPS